MKKWIAGGLLVTTLLGTAGPALADTATTPAPAATAPAPTAPDTAPVPTATSPAPTTPATPPAPETGTTPAAPGAQAGATPAAPGAQDGAGPDVNATLPKVSVTPDSFFYSLKLFLEKIRLAITTDAVSKATLLEQQAQTRMAEAQAMAVAGEADLAAQALNQAKVSFAEVQKQIQVAVKANRNISAIEAKVSADETRFAKALAALVAKAPEDVKALVEPQTADLLVQVATAQDTAKPDPKVEEQAKEVEEKAEHKQELSALQPRMVLVLDAMAKASGKKLDDVLMLYVAHPGLGNLARQLGLKMGPIQHAAQIQWKLLNREATEKSSTTAEGPDSSAPAATPATVATPASTPALASVRAKKGAEKAEKDHDKAEKEHDKGHKQGHGKGD